MISLQTISSHHETSGYLLRAVLSVDNQAVDPPLHFVRELDVMRAMLHPLLIFPLGRLPSVHVFDSSITITFHLTAHGALAYSYYLGDGGHRHRPLQHHGYCVPLLRRQVFVFHAIFWWFLRLQRYIPPAKSLSSDRLFFFLGGYLQPGLRGDPGNGSPRPTEDNLLTHLCNQTSKVAH